MTSRLLKKVKKILKKCLQYIIDREIIYLVQFFGTDVILSNDSYLVLARLGQTITA